jgi:hypothetical protein
MAKPVLLISGVPGTGKSTFGRWLEERKGFMHVDMDFDGLKRHDLETSWDQFLKDLSCDVFWRRLLEDRKPVFLDWGFPVRCLPVVEALRRQGVRVWWFTGDRLFARLNYLKAKGPYPRSFDFQFADISANWLAISPIFEDRIIRTVWQDGRCMTCDEIYHLIQRGDVATCF